jgi:tetratricopeptide (TPR) repeat protein
MKLDEFGFPRPADFDERPAKPPRAAGVTGRRVGLLVGAVLIALAGAAIVEFGPEIEAKLARALNVGGRGPEAMQQAMIQAMREQRFGDAAAICGKLVRMQPKNARLQMLQAQLFLQAGQDKKAIGVCDELVSKNPGDEQPLLLKASIQAKIGQYKEAVKTSDEVLKLAPDDPTALNNRAYFRALARVDLKEALDDVQRALKEQPDNETFIDTRAYLFYLFGRFDEALADYNRILEDGGPRMQLEDVGEIYFHRGLLFKHMGDDRRMKEDYDRARRSGFKITEEPPPHVLKGVKKA